MGVNSRWEILNPGGRGEFSFFFKKNKNPLVHRRTLSLLGLLCIFWLLGLPVCCLKDYLELKSCAWSHFKSFGASYGSFVSFMSFGSFDFNDTRMIQNL